MIAARSNIRNGFLLCICFFFIGSYSGFAQLKKANEHYDNLEFSTAIPLYLKVLKKREDPEVIQKLARSYRVTKNYELAEVFYSKVVQLPNTDPTNFYYYGLILKNNNKCEEAKKQFLTYSVLTDDTAAANKLINSCEKIQKLSSDKPLYVVSNVTDINSKHSEFSPAFFNNGLVFTSDRPNDLVNFEKYGWNQEDFLSLFYSELKSENDKLVFKSPQLLSKLNSVYHDGPACFSADQKNIFFTRVNYLENKKDSTHVNRPGIYYAALKKDDPAKFEAFPFNTNEYSVAHPSISFDGQLLFFSSDMPGGYGGKDVYVSKKEKSGWSTPKNIGSAVNTPGDEVFPYIRQDGLLFFSSDYHLGSGGLDIFYSTQVGEQWSSPINAGIPLNSSTDDFGLLFSDDNKSGYFSSDRPGGKGKDDIYSFTELDNFMKVAGKVLLSNNINDPSPDTKVLLLSEDGKIVMATLTDKVGFFQFNHLPPDEKYLIKLDERDSSFSYRKKYYLADENDKIVGVAVDKGAKGKFIFQPLPPDDIILTQMDEQDPDLKLAGTLLLGEHPSKPIADTKIDLVNKKGEIIQTTKTNALGSFLFVGVSSQQDFTLQLNEEADSLLPNAKVAIVTKQGKEILSTTTDAEGNFKFEILASDENVLSLMDVEDSKIKLDVEGKFLFGDVTVKEPVANKKINLLNKHEEIVGITVTDSTGYFAFYNLPMDQKYSVMMDAAEAKFLGLRRLFLADKTGRVVKELRPNIKGDFKYEIIPYEENSLTTIYEDDPWLEVLSLKGIKIKDSITIVESVYYNVNDWTVLPEARKTLDKVISIMKNDVELQIELSSHTDARGSDKLNMDLSKKRAKAAVDYVLKQGITPDRITGRGYGESRLINNCDDDVSCSEEEHARNRRTEFKIVRKK